MSILSDKNDSRVYITQFSTRVRLNYYVRTLSNVSTQQEQSLGAVTLAPLLAYNLPGDSVIT